MSLCCTLQCSSALVIWGVRSRTACGALSRDLDLSLCYYKSNSFSFLPVLQQRSVQCWYISGLDYSLVIFSKNLSSTQRHTFVIYDVYCVWIWLEQERSKRNVCPIRLQTVQTIFVSVKKFLAKNRRGLEPLMSSRCEIWNGSRELEGKNRVFGRRVHSLAQNK